MQWSVAMPTTSTSLTLRARSHCAKGVPSASAPSKPLLEALWAPLKNTACTLPPVTAGAAHRPLPAFTDLLLERASPVGRRNDDDIAILTVRTPDI